VSTTGDQAGDPVSDAAGDAAGMDRWRITVDRSVCVGSGMCTAIAPQHFRLDQNRSRPLREVAEPDQAVLDAAESCPTEAISVRDGGGRLLAPEE
jgi:ferredoxin